MGATFRMLADYTIGLVIVAVHLVMMAGHERRAGRREELAAGRSAS